MTRPAAITIAVLLAGCATPKVTAIVAPVVDLRAQPHTDAQAGTHDPLQETQLLYGELVRVLKTEDGWAQVEAVEQPEFTHARKWQGYPGWVPASALSAEGRPWPTTIVVSEPWVETWQDAYRRQPSTWRFPMGTRLRAIEMGRQLWQVELLDGQTVWMPYAAARSLEELAALPPLERRQLILRHAERLIGEPYYWGGRSPADPRVLNKRAAAHGLDCSGLVNLTYRAAGLDIPRDAHEQFLNARRLNAPQPADLIFLSERGNPERIVHVMLYAGDGKLIEGPGTGLSVRRISVEDRLKQPLDWLTSGTVVDGQTVSFGSYAP
ncbi:MAG: C40 family peptidase [Candidatus Omnitrophica bacterium]|nr:C40 family peptidase [Candidatus Omnitrophota bacterium]